MTSSELSLRFWLPTAGRTNPRPGTHPRDRQGSRWRPVRRRKQRGRNLVRGRVSWDILPPWGSGWRGVVGDGNIPILADIYAHPLPLATSKTNMANKGDNANSCSLLIKAGDAVQSVDIITVRPTQQVKSYVNNKNKSFFWSCYSLRYCFNLLSVKVLVSSLYLRVSICCPNIRVYIWSFTLNSLVPGLNRNIRFLIINLLLF